MPFNIFVDSWQFFFQDSLVNIKLKRLETEICNIINVFSVNFDNLNVSLQRLSDNVKVYSQKILKSPQKQHERMYFFKLHKQILKSQSHRRVVQTECPAGPDVTLDF